MNDQAFQLLLDRFDQVDKRLDKGDERMGKIETSLDKLWRFRWWLAGAAAATGTLVGFVLTTLFNLAELLLKHP